MSWLLLDAGNSALKWILVPAADTQWPEGGAEPAMRADKGYDRRDEPGTRRDPHRGTHVFDTPGLAGELARACAGSATVGGGAVPEAVFGCAVTAPARIAAVDAALAAAGAGPVHWLPAAAEFRHATIALRNGYRDPAQLGADRWHALIGARARFGGGALVVVCAGTATTVDGVTPAGAFCGGAIGPGVDLMRASLAQGTARLPLAAGQYAAHPDNTDDAIRTGILDAQLGMIERRVRHMHESTGMQPLVVLSGGHGAALAGHLLAQYGSGRVALEPDLVLRGLWHRARAITAAAIAAPP